MVKVRAVVQLLAIAAAFCVASTSVSAEDTAGFPARVLQATASSTAEDSEAPVTRTPEVTTTPPATTTPAPTTTAPDSPSPVTVLPVPLPTLVTPAPTTAVPTSDPSPAPAPTTAAPTSDPSPAPAPTTVAPTPEPTTVAPTPEPTTAAPTPEPTTAVPAPVPTTVAPIPDPTTAAPVPDPTTATPVPVPTTATPVPVPTTLVPVPDPTTAAPVPTTPAPVPTTPAPVPTTAVPGPTTPAPIPDPTTPAPVPTTVVPVPGPTTPAPSPVPTTVVPVPDPSTPAPGPTTPTPTTDPVTPVPTSATPRPSTVAPPLVDVPIATESPDTPAPTVTKKGTVVEEDTTEPEDNTQANTKDIIVFDSKDATDPPKVNPFEIREINSESPKPVVLDIRDESSTTAEPKLYVRGSKTDSPAVLSGSGSGSTKGTKSTTASSSRSPASAPNVIGGSHRNTATSAESILSTTSAAFHDFLRYATCAFAGISVALLLFFHYVSLDATLTWTSSLWSPNTWEFILYVGYLQQMASVSQLTLLKTPYFLWDYADSFAWTNFLIQRSTNSVNRRLETIVLGGVVAYADRIGITESQVVYHSVVGFAVVLAVLLVVFLVIAVLAKRKAETALDDPASMHESTQSVHRLRSASIRTLGLCVLIWYFALYPLSVYASFEISMQVQAKQTVASALMVSILALGVVCFGVLAWCGRVIMHKSKDELLQFENMATWGSLYAEFSFRSRMFFVLGALVQIVTGIIVGTMDSDPTQLIIVILIDVLYLVAVFVLSPFAEVLVLRFTYALGLLKIVNFSLSFGFLNSNGMTGTSRNSVANAFIGINTLVIIFWFIRQLIVFSTYIRAWSVRSSFAEERDLEDSTAKYETRTATDSEVYASVTTARHGDSGPATGSDNYHHAPPAPREVGF